MNRDVISVFIYRYSDPTSLIRCLLSICENSYDDLSLYIVKDGPVTEPCDRVVRSAGEITGMDVTVVTLEKSANFGGALEKFIGQLDNYRLLFRMDDDDVVLPGRLVKQKALMEANPELMITYGEIYEFEEPDHVMRLRQAKQVLSRFDWIRLQFRSPINHVTVCFRNHFFRHGVGFDSASPYEDWKLWQMVFNAGFVAHAKIAEPLVAVSFSNKQLGTRAGRNAARAELEHYRSLAARKTTTALSGVALLVRMVSRLLGVRFIKSGIGIFRKSIGSQEAEEVSAYIGSLNRQAQSWQQHLSNSTEAFKQAPPVQK